MIKIERNDRSLSQLSKVELEALLENKNTPARTKNKIRNYLKV